jgi:glycosyltransferase involved in cell wall biosynthesis
MSSISGRTLRSLSNAVTRRVLRDSRFVFVYGTQAKEDALALGASEDQIVIAKHSIPDTHFDCAQHHLSSEERLAMRRNLGLHDGPLFLCVSQLIPRKGIQDLLEAFSQVRRTHPEAQLLLIGKGVLDAMVQARARDSGGALAWLPGVPYAEIPKYYLLSDCFVFPTHFDAWGFMINESHWSKLPVISSDAAFAARDLIVHGQSGLVVPAGNVAALAEAMEYGLDHPSEMRRMAECGYHFVKTQWNEQETTRLWARHIELALQEGSR